MLSHSPTALYWASLRWKLGDVHSRSFEAFPPSRSITFETWAKRDSYPPSGPFGASPMKLDSFGEIPIPGSLPGKSSDLGVVDSGMGISCLA